MGLPRFFDRVADSVLPVMNGVRRDDFAAKLAATAVTLEAPAGSHEANLGLGFLLAANLCARVYPAIGLIGPSELTDNAAELIRWVNPKCDLTTGVDPNPRLSFRKQPESPGGFVTASGWNAVIDSMPRKPEPAQVPAALVAGALGASELFRTVFGPLLGNRARTKSTPGGFNLVTLAKWSSGVDSLEDGLDLGDFHLVGAGAVGEAAAEVLRRVNVRGHITVVDDEYVTEANLQRYVLAGDVDEGDFKTTVIDRALSGGQLIVKPVSAKWGAHPAAQPNAVTTVLVAVDSAGSRIAIQAALPLRIYNAFTGRLDLGWSRHEHFGVDPCLACLYWPDTPRQNRHEEIASSLGQHPLRVLGYLASGQPVGTPLRQVGDVPGLEKPPDWQMWLNSSLLADIGSASGLQAGELEGWADKSIDFLYREGVCGGTLVLSQTDGSTTVMEVPLAHQSALAGIMLATEFLIASSPHLISLRPELMEARYDVLGEPNQILARPRSRSPHCLCGDADYLERYANRWKQAPLQPR